MESGPFRTIQSAWKTLQPDRTNTTTGRLRGHSTLPRRWPGRRRVQIKVEPQHVYDPERSLLSRSNIQRGQLSNQFQFRRHNQDRQMAGMAK